jgi:hypothetical protein
MPHLPCFYIFAEQIPLLSFPQKKSFYTCNHSRKLNGDLGFGMSIIPAGTCKIFSTGMFHQKNTSARLPIIKKLNHNAGSIL